MRAAPWEVSSPTKQLTSPIPLIIKDNGMIITGNGIIIVLKTHINKALFPGNLSLAKANAAIEWMIKAKTMVTITATKSEFPIPVRTSSDSNTSLNDIQAQKMPWNDPVIKYFRLFFQ